VALFTGAELDWRGQRGSVKHQPGIGNRRVVQSRSIVGELPLPIFAGCASRSQLANDGFEPYSVEKLRNHKYEISRLRRVI